VLRLRGELGHVVPIRQFLDDTGAFGPDDLDALGKAFSAALQKLGLHDLRDPITEIVARRIIRAASPANAIRSG
jgi:hypothetical protein